MPEDPPVRFFSLKSLIVTVVTLLGLGIALVHPGPGPGTAAFHSGKPDHVKLARGGG